MATHRHTPAGRGYETFLGYYHHANGYWNEELPLTAIGHLNVCDNKFVDLWLDDGPAHGLNGSADCGSNAFHDKCHTSCNDRAITCSYEDDLFRNHTVSLIKAHDPSEPLFVFHAFHVVHTPLQVPLTYLNRFPAAARNCTYPLCQVLTPISYACQGVFSTSSLFCSLRLQCVLTVLLFGRYAGMQRATYDAMVAFMDEAVASIVGALKDKGM